MVTSITVNISSYTGRLVHVNPDTIDINASFGIVEALELVSPVSNMSTTISTVNHRKKTKCVLLNILMEPI